MNKLNIHFSSIGKQTSTQKGNPLVFTDNLRRINNSFFLFDVTETKVFNIVKSLDSNKASGEGSLSVKILKKVNNLISPIVSNLIKQAIFDGVYLSSLKLGKVIPIFK